MELDVQASLRVGKRPLLRPSELRPQTIAPPHKILAAGSVDDGAHSDVLPDHLADTLCLSLSMADRVGAGEINKGLHEYFAKPNIACMLSSGMGRLQIPEYHWHGF